MSVVRVESQRFSDGTESSIGFVEFKIFAPGARMVTVAGDFTAWYLAPQALTNLRDGFWAITMALSPGKHDYKFVVDGNWIESEADDFTHPLGRPVERCSVDG